MIWIKSEDVILIHSKIIHSTGGVLMGFVTVLA